MPYFNRFDIVEAYYVYFSEWHEGQWSDGYRRLCRMRRYFSPRPSLSIDTLSANARAIYDGLAFAKQKGRE